MISSISSRVLENGFAHFEEEYGSSAALVVKGTD